MARFPSFKQENGWADLLSLWKACESITFLGIGYFFFLKWAAFLALKKSYFDWHTIFTMFSNRMHKELRIFSLLILYIGSLRLHFELLPSLKLKKKKKPLQAFYFYKLFYLLALSVVHLQGILLTLRIHTVIGVYTTVLEKPHHPDMHSSHSLQTTFWWLVC